MLKKALTGLALSACLVSSVAIGQTDTTEPLDMDMVNRIWAEGFNHSEVMDTLGYLTDVIGPRLTGTPQMREANDWTLEKFAEWGLENGELEGFEFGRGWTFSKSVVRMTAPRESQLYALPLSWHPGTNGPVEGDVVKVSIKSKEDFEEYEGKLDGKIVLLSEAMDADDPTRVPFRRWTEEELQEREAFRVPTGERGGAGGFAKLFLFEQDLFKFLKDQGAVAAVRRSPRDGALIEASAYLHGPDQTPELPAVSMTTEDYERILRLLDRDMPVSLEIEVEARYHDGDSQSYNTLAEIRGQGRNPEIVLAGAHLDSWFIGDGAVDNGAGTAVVMEAARILKALGVTPKRTIRFALWGGEEQGLYGSEQYVRSRLADRPEPDDETQASLPAFFWFNDSYPITTKPAHEKFSAYFNLDNGSGKIRGIYSEGNLAVKPIFERWLEPFDSLGASTVTVNATGGTDHMFFDQVGLPAFQFIQDPLDYGSRLHHTQIDTYDHVSEADLKQAAVIMASFLYHAAMRDERLPREPLPTAPKGAAE